MICLECAGEYWERVKAAAIPEQCDDNHAHTPTCDLTPMPVNTHACRGCNSWQH